MRYVGESVPRDKLRANVSINLSRFPDKGEIKIFLFKNKESFNINPQLTATEENYFCLFSNPVQNLVESI